MKIARLYRFLNIRVKNQIQLKHFSTLKDHCIENLNYILVIMLTAILQVTGFYL